MKKKSENPFIGYYAPEMDNTPALDQDLASWYQSLIGILRWVVEIGRVDILTEVSMMASHMAMPREGHLEAVLHMVSFLRQKYNSMIAFEPTYPAIDMNDFKEWKWKGFYGILKESIPPNDLEKRGKEVDLRGYVDSNHAGEKKTRRSRYGVLIFLNNVLVQWFSKKNSTIETSVFGA